ncbi:MAG: SPASM domain-containing protein [Candidatus Omnitrophica bacterium]|nr:SPASM domain-containing protein [Candidatus Omnitrophota bacterium]
MSRWTYDEARQKDIAVLEITTRLGCPVACTYCPQGKITKAYQKRSSVGTLSFETFEQCLAKVPQDVHLVFGGMAEPWLNSECTPMVLKAHERGHTIGIDTTLTGMDVKDVEAIQGIPFWYFAVHLPTKEGYEKIRVDEHYLSVVRALEASRIGAVYRLYGGTLHPELSFLKYEEEPLNSRAGNVAIEGLPSEKRIPGRIRCGRNLIWNVLLPNGDVVICSSDYGMKHVLGNLKESTYESLFRSDEFLKVQRGMKDPKEDILCRYCYRYTFKDDWRMRLREYLAAFFRKRPSR